MDKLISLIDFVEESRIKSKVTPFEYEQNEIDSKELLKIYKYANFLKKPLSLSMFLPCDENNNPIEEITEFDPDISSQYYASQLYNNQLYEEAKEQEVFEALKNEAVKRGYKKGVIVKTLFHINNPELTIRLEDFELVRGNAIHCSGEGGLCPVIFENGVWAEILEQITLSEAEQQLKKKIIV